MSDAYPGPPADRFPSNAEALAQAFDNMEKQALALKHAQARGDQAAFSTASRLLREAQVIFLRIHNRFPAETATFLAARQEDVLDGVAFDPFAPPLLTDGTPDAKDD